MMIFHMCMYLCISILVKIRNEKNEYISFYIQLNMFYCIKNSFTFYQHLRPQIISLVNTKNQPNSKKRNHFP